MNKGNCAQVTAAFRLPNIRLFVIFRVVFNTRLYYPVFTILFLDFGLSLEQFALLNAVWALTIVVAEVPSGALADLLGRKRLLVATSLLMVLEMALLGFMPLGHPTLMFWVFFANRVISGLAEALASGTDEALAYDTLVEHGLTDCWPHVLERQMRAQNVGYMVGMTLGALVYDASALNRIFAWLSLPPLITAQMSMRFPIFLTLGLGLVAVLTTLRMREPLPEPKKGRRARQRQSPRAFTRQIVGAGKWIYRTPMALAIILLAMTFDHVLRLVATLTSQYYRLIGLPEASFGLLGSAVAVIGLFVPRLARLMAQSCSYASTALIVAGIGLAALGATALFLPYFGVLPIFLVFVGLMLTSFFTSHYLNAITASSQRATVLSFKGLAFNAAFGVVGLAFSGLIRHFHQHLAATHPTWSAAMVEDQAFRTAMGCLPWYLALVLVLVLLICLLRFGHRPADNS